MFCQFGTDFTYTSEARLVPEVFAPELRVTRIMVSVVIGTLITCGRFFGSARFGTRMTRCDANTSGLASFALRWSARSRSGGSVRRTAAAKLIWHFSASLLLSALFGRTFTRSFVITTR
ncbi:MAG: hypothetical protein A3G81_00255 [Betaproteobacteria bacterium RIFCSPLOWO2_12_FULL_65_14]|nr:MAG: hypothetical protein A3G81_00255 [Betaproteobacteria bacterium RIFCSPLOWO2_12_FULL_65_14]